MKDPTDQSHRIHPTAYVGAVYLTVADLERSVRFYTDGIGLQVLEMARPHASLGVGEQVLLRMEELPGATKDPGRTGLYHFALLLPERVELARALRHLSDSGIRFTGFADHHVSEALYLNDPDGHGIEIYRDRPRTEWLDAHGRFKLTTAPLDLHGLLGELEKSPAKFTQLPTTTVMGHIHLHVAHLEKSRLFYGDILGFDLMAGMDSALFMSAGGYHHHLGLNIWQGAGAPPASEGSLRLIAYEIWVPDELGYRALLGRLQAHDVALIEANGLVEFDDPSSNRIRFMH